MSQSGEVTVHGLGHGHSLLYRPGRAASVLASPLLLLALPMDAIELQRHRLEHLKQTKASICYCSQCGKKLKFGSFTVHPCYKDVLARLGLLAAKRLVSSSSPRRRRVRAFAPIPADLSRSGLGLADPGDCACPQSLLLASREAPSPSIAVSRATSPCSS